MKHNILSVMYGMKLKNRVSIAVYCIMILILIFDSNTALRGAREGIETSIKTIVPSMFPYIFLIGLLVRSFESTKTNRSILSLCGIPRGTEYLYIMGLIGGYPAGAKCIYNAYQCGQLSQKDAEHLLLFCNNPGPAFIFGVLSCIFNNKVTLWVIWLIQILSSLITAYIFKRNTDVAYSPQHKDNKTFIQIFNDAIKTTCTICGWIILGKVLLSFISKWFLRFFPWEISVLLAGMIELSNGCLALREGISEVHQIILCSAMLTMGGFCIIMQIASVTNGLSIRSYFLGKSIQLPLVVILTAIYCDCFILQGKYAAIYVAIFISFLLFIFLIRQKTKNNTGNNIFYRV